MPKRRFLLLQGVCSPFFARLGERLEAEGHKVFKVNFTAGDWLGWRGRRSYHYRGSLGDLNGFIKALWLREGITDQILFGDRRPVHRAAVDQAQRFGIRTHVFEEGYFRPNWVTLEREGVNGHSLLPRDPDWFREVHPSLPQREKPVAFHSPFRKRAVRDVAYHLAGSLNPVLYPGYRTHHPATAPVLYAGYLRRFALLPHWTRQDAGAIDALLASREGYFLFPLQLNTDAQIVHHSRFVDMCEAIDRVISSFAHHAPSVSRLVIKNHPLDMGLVDYRRFIARRVSEYDLGNRVVYLETGDLGKLVAKAAGLVTVNSTAGGVALGAKCPTLALADPIYNLPGLTFQHGLDAFWQERSQPDSALFRAFKDTVLYTTQLNGGFYCRKGCELAVANAVKRLSAEKSPLESLL